MYNRLGQYNKAKELHEKALTIRKQIFGEDYKYIERVRSELALVNKHLVSSRAEDRYEKAYCLILSTVFIGNTSLSRSRFRLLLAK